MTKMLKVRIKIPLILAVFFLLSVLNICMAQGSEPSYGDAIVVSSISDARTLVPILASDSASSDICGMLFNGLTKYDKDLHIIGDLADPGFGRRGAFRGQHAAPL